MMTKTEIQTAMHSAGFTRGQRESVYNRERCARLIEQTRLESFGRDSLMAVAAFRYSLGRMTYIVSDCADWLIANWPRLPSNAQKIIQRDLDEAFIRDNDARQDGSEYKPLGHDRNRAQWERVRALWVTPNEKSEPTSAALSRDVGSTDVL